MLIESLFSFKNVSLVNNGLLFSSGALKSNQEVSKPVTLVNNLLSVSIHLKQVFSAIDFPHNKFLKCTSISVPGFYSFASGSGNFGNLKNRSPDWQTEQVMAVINLILKAKFMGNGYARYIFVTSHLLCCKTSPCVKWVYSKRKNEQTLFL